ncbi:hypothetical protein ART_4045 [Arthrobacter sp. PAMC 25486]|uniref:hypothetical protein n=1 Tax=Arthrobacter sp. PAMC 25486 TaxID=1494608 RepID=UPI000535B39A|nr:hypothetical protein [Arthrobacter sp. PAMC 25486]AIY03644.1 hypothetical protein ART_4045 [Arthrobacter sp. PAMC 25486]
MRKILLAAMAAAVLAVLFASAQGTAALWRAEGTLKPGSITTGSLSLAVGDGTSTSEDFAFEDLNTSTLAPGGFVQAPLTISNTGTTALGYSLAGATSATTAPGVADTELIDAVELSVHVTHDSAACGENLPSTGEILYVGPLNGTVASAGRSLEPAASETLCIQVALPTEAPQEAAGGKLQLVLSWSGDQL